ncbi:MAG: tetratricopeptide repeat protein [Chloroflexi bacterium]|nr:MAG: tetratricopeptide repeat protein [Chloroflexota bacterium]MBL1196508.1 tetratricopeptide repeat protein [Chloroflexota bacterium]NOH13803.1 tetratricopeptide repeat protein [Chloroflexota bacterium]
MSILLTKVRVPQRRRDVLRRVRLIDSLHQNLHRKLTFVSAPAGFGKTTLLSDFASDIVSKVCWYQISPEDSDLIPFLNHVIAAFREHFPAFGQELTETLGVGGTPDPNSMATEIINQIEIHVDDFTVFVLDDYHLVGESDSIVSFIESLLEFLPEQVRLVMGSRSVYGIPTANLYVREELGTLSADDLRFRADELQTLVHQNYHVKLSDEQASELAKRSDGWILAILLAIRTMEHGALPKFEGALDQIYEFLAKDVINRLPQDLREFMMAVSVVDEFDLSLCEYLLESKDAKRLLGELEDRNLFVAKVQTEDGLTYRYHQLFAEFLRLQLDREEPQRVNYLHQRAALWYQQREAWELAVRHMLEAGDREKAAVWMDGVTEQFFVSGRYNLLSDWYESLIKPVDIRKMAPRLLLTRAKSLINLTEYESAEQLLDIAEEASVEESGVEQIANIKIERSMSRREQGLYDQAIQLADSTQKYLEEHQIDIEKSTSWHVAERIIGVSLHFSGKGEGALEHLSRAIRYFESEPKRLGGNGVNAAKYVFAETLNDLGFVYYSQGNLHEAQNCFSRALEIQQKLRSNRGVIALALNNVGYLYYEAGHYHEAWNYFEEAWEYVEKTKLWRFLMLILNSRGDLLCDLGEYDDAEKAYRNAIAIGERENLTRYLYDTYRGLGLIERKRGNYSEVSYWIREMARVQGDSLDLPIYQLYQGWLYLDMGQLELACKSLKAASNIQKKPQKEHALAAFLLARTLIELGKISEAFASLSNALLWTAQLGYNQFLVVAAKEDIDFLRFALRESPSSQLESFVKQVEGLQLGFSAIRNKARPVESLDIHLDVQAFGFGHVRKNGELIANSEWRSNGARALFYYIVDQKGIRKEDVALEFWPEFSPAKVSSNFHATLWRVRRALGHKDVILYQDGLYKLNPEITVWYDVEEFENRVEQARDTSLQMSERVSLWRSAIDLVADDFLNDIFMDWSDERRSQLQEHYTLVVRELAQWNFAQRRFDDARNLYEKILSLDPYQDQIHLDLMKCLVAEGSASAAKAHFKSYEELLIDELQAEPQDELRKYYEKIG